jgi:AAA15 family ATPase/GTPase
MVKEIDTETRKIQENKNGQAEKANLLRLKKISIKNFKAIDELEIEFPEPLMPHYPDTFAFGSRNGGGKTSVLEACSVLFFVVYYSLGTLPSNLFSSKDLSLSQFFLKAGAKIAHIAGDFEISSRVYRIKISLEAFGINLISLNELRELKISLKNLQAEDTRMFDSNFQSIIGYSPEPLLLPRFLYFHSYRKIQAGYQSLNFSSTSANDSILKSSHINSFKVVMRNALLGQKGVFEKLEEDDSQEILDKLNALVKQFAGGEIHSLRPSPYNEGELEFRVTPSDGGPSFNFDGLSSGQKEVISTLFLIWYNTRNQPGIVLIDEPELHLNAEWHNRFVRELSRMVPHNQYILATHSQYVFGAIDKRHRAILRPTKEK